MKKTKYLIGILLLFMIVGFAAVSVTLSIRGTTRVASTLDDFKVYFSNVLVDGEQDFSVVRNETELYFDILIEEVGDTHNIVYDVTNGSKYYDAQLSINCTASNEYLNIVNNIDTSTNLLSKETRQGTLSLTKTKTIASNEIQNNAVSCKLSATPVERTSINNNTPATPVSPYYIGREISIGEEKFNIISSDEDSVTMLAQKNISETTPNKQTDNQEFITFSNLTGWEYEPGPKEIDIQSWDGEAKTVLNNYIDYLKTEYNVDVVGNIITLSELGILGCTIPSDYANDSGGWTCNNSQYSEWLVNNQYWWTRSAYSENAHYIWMVKGSGSLNADWYDNSADDEIGVRPTITISKELCYALITKYKVGDEITIGTEKFNVINDNLTTVTMLAKYNLYMGDSTTQSSEQVWSLFSSENGWEYTPGPKEIDIQNFEGRAKLKVNKYLVYLKEKYNIDGTGDLISVSELGRLGCKIPENYSSQHGGNCKNSKHKDWLINNQHFWTKSAIPESPDHLWVLSDGGTLYTDIHSGYYGVRPVITISKGALSK